METDRLKEIALAALVGSSLGLISSAIGYILPDRPLLLLAVSGTLLLVGFSIYLVYATRVLVDLLPPESTDTQQRPS